MGVFGRQKCPREVFSRRKRFIQVKEKDMQLRIFGRKRQVKRVRRPEVGVDKTNRKRQHAKCMIYRGEMLIKTEPGNKKTLSEN